jgi:hypothetical protein
VYNSRECCCPVTSEGRSYFLEHSLDVQSCLVSYSSMVEYRQVRFVMFRGSSILPIAVVEMEHTLTDILHILQVDKDDDKRTG